MKPPKFQKVSKADLAFFQQTPWCAQLLADPAYAAIVTPTRIPKSDREDSFFAETLAAPETIERCMTLYRIPTNENATQLEEVIMLLSTGLGLNGYPRVLQGGFVATVLDEVTGQVVSLSKRPRVAVLKSQWTPKTTSFTAYMNVTYKKPVPTPGVILARAVKVSVEGRKRFLRGTIEDGQGTVYAVADTLYVDVQAKL